MKRKLNVGAVMILMVVAAAVTFNITSVYYMNSFNQKFADLASKESQYAKLAELDEMVQNNYYGEVNNDEISDYLCYGYIAGLGDKYSAYYNQKDFEALYGKIEGSAQGIGVNVAEDKEIGAITVVNVMKNSPAEKAGLLAGDSIVKVGGKTIVELGGYSAGFTALKGDKGSIAEITVLRDGKTLEFSVVREDFELETVWYRMVDDIGYIEVTNFDTNTPVHFTQAVDSLIAEGARALIFDMRHNTGGEVNAVCECLDLLVPEGPVIRIYDKNGNVETVDSGADEVNLPMAVLIDAQTYSAAELFSATMRDYEKAVLIGVNTYGKGAVQTVMKLSDGSGLALTTKMYAPPKSEN